MPELKTVVIFAVRYLLKRCVPIGLYIPLSARRDERDAARVPRRILLLHPGHLGDIIISTSVLEPLEKFFPGVQVGFIAGSWSAGALRDVKGISDVHILDHWRLNRSTQSLRQKWSRYRTTRASAIKALRILRYDVAISLLDANPDLLDIAWAARIPIRVGWNSSYFAPLATRLVANDPTTLRHQAERQAQTLLALRVPPSQLTHLQSRVVEDTPTSIAEVCGVLGLQSLEGVRFRVIHMGAGAPMKQMPDIFWREVVVALAPAHTLLFTGRGETERSRIEAVMQGLSNCISACDRLTWEGFVAAVRAAEMLYGVDSMAGHVAAAVDTPVAAAYQGAGGVSRWRPLHPAATVFTNHLSCAPCLLPNGCEDMPCKNIDPKALLTVLLPTAMQQYAEDAVHPQPQLTHAG